MDTSKITNVLIFKDGYYYLTVKFTLTAENMKEIDKLFDQADAYKIVEDIDYNGFEFASDAYAYLAKLKDGNTPKHTEPEE